MTVLPRLDVIEGVLNTPSLVLAIPRRKSILPARLLIFLLASAFILNGELRFVLTFFMVGSAT